MKTKVLFSLMSIIVLSLFGFNDSNNNVYINLEQNIDSLFSQGDLMGFSACIIKNNKIEWMYAKGMADNENNIPVSSSTVFMLGSTSKVFTGTALLQLYEEGKFDLDEDINKYLPFKIRNPNFPDSIITFRMLLTHTSSLKDVYPYIFELYGKGDQIGITFEEILRNCYYPEGSQYKVSNFAKFKPGEKWNYCNLNFILIAYLVERLSGKSFNEFTRKRIFNPLQMNETGWFYADFDTTHIAVNYQRNENDSIRLSRVNHYHWPGYADGCLHTSCIQLANFFQMLMNSGNYNGKQILKPETVSLMLSKQNISGTPVKFTPPIIDYGLSWMVTECNSRIYFMHGGGGSGIMTLVWFNPELKSGAIIMLTGDWNKDKMRYDSILFPLFCEYLK